MTHELPEPLTPPDCDLRGFRTMPLDVDALKKAAIIRKAPPEALRAALLLWCSAWHEVPAASLPDDDDELAAFAGFGYDVAAWQAVKVAAMRGFKLCRDGRWYHEFMAGEALQSWGKRLKYRERAQKGGEGKAAKRAENKRDPATSSAKAVLAPAKGEGEGSRIDSSPTPPAPVLEAREWRRRLVSVFGPAIDPQRDGERFLAARAGSILQSWIANGFDLELDAVPVVIDLTAEAGANIRGWNYFTAAIAQSKANRLAKIPIPEARAARPKFQSGPAPIKIAPAPVIVLPNKGPLWWIEAAPKIAKTNAHEFAAFFERAEIASSNPPALYAENGVAEDRMRGIAQAFAKALGFEIQILRRKAA